MRYEVPQFIEVEDKIIGPLSFRQFVYIAGAGGLVVILYLFTPLFVVVLIGGPVVILAAALAFYKVNDRPFVLTLEAALNYFTRSKLYIWRKTQKKKEEESKEKEGKRLVSAPSLSQNKLKDLAWSLDIKESMYEDEMQAR